MATGRLLVSCEHGGRGVPREWAPRFRGARALLDSHRAWDPGALSVARALARATGAPLVASTTTRLLVDLNRSPHNPAVFSQVTRGLPRAARDALLARHHAPHWRRVRAQLRRLGAGGSPVLHLAVHSFTPVLRGARRRFQVGLLYDPKRRRERRLARAWQARLTRAHPALRVRRNAPYRGAADGLTTALRRELPASAYLGLELELNQAWLGRPDRRAALTRALATLLAGPEVRG